MCFRSAGCATLLLCTMATWIRTCLLTGAVLHDIGKVAELTYERSFGYSSEGQLLGHIVIGLRLLHEKLQQVPDFPPKLRVLVEHLIISHHGELEYGSPKVPLFPEAMLLHHLDNLDSKMECMRALAEKDRHIEGCWTGYSPSLERSILKKAKYLEDAPAREARSDPAPARRARRGLAEPARSGRASANHGSRRAALLSRRNCSKHGARIPDAGGDARHTPRHNPRRRQVTAAGSGGPVYRRFIPVFHVARAAAVLHRRRPDEPVRLLEPAGQLAGEGQHFLLDALLSSLRRHRLPNAVRDLRLQSLPGLRRVLRGDAGESVARLSGVQPDRRIGGSGRDRDAAVCFPRQARITCTTTPARCTTFFASCSSSWRC